MPRKRRKTEAQPLELRFERLTPHSTPNQIYQRAKLLQDLLHNAVKDGEKAYGIKLRRSAKIHFVIHGSVKVVLTTVNNEEKEGQALMTSDEAWRFTAMKARKILGSMLEYALFAERIRKIQMRLSRGEEVALRELPEKHPSVHFTPFIKPLFGTVYKDLYGRLVELKKVLETRRAAIKAVSAESETVTVEEAVKEVSEAVDDAATVSDIE